MEDQKKLMNSRKSSSTPWIPYLPKEGGYYGPFQAAYHRLRKNGELIKWLQAVRLRSGRSISTIVCDACFEEYGSDIIVQPTRDSYRIRSSYDQPRSEVIEQVMILLRKLRDERGESLASLVETACRAWIDRHVSHIDERLGCAIWLKEQADHNAREAARAAAATEVYFAARARLAAVLEAGLDHFGLQALPPWPAAALYRPDPALDTERFCLALAGEIVPLVRDAGAPEPTLASMARRNYDVTGLWDAEVLGAFDGTPRAVVQET